MIKTLLLLTCAFALTNCVYSRTIEGPDGTTHQLVSCSNIAFCYEKASQVCGGHYKIVNTTTDPYYNGNSWDDIQMLVKCQW